jgi:hypothetical protein
MRFFEDDTIILNFNWEENDERENEWEWWIVVVSSLFFLISSSDKENEKKMRKKEFLENIINK